MAHPRSRGENVGALSGGGCVQGSSPLTRGKPCRTGNTRPCLGLIPAHAGKTRSSRVPYSRSRAHPRSRGENYPHAEMSSNHPGSSPLTRGKPEKITQHMGHEGLIPAHAGKTRPGTSCSVTRGAHPRSRGENHCGAHESGRRGGSSPLTRGKPWLLCSERSPRRLIPAHAGKTCVHERRGESRRAHPRSRGENSRMSSRTLRPGGSSPLTRGKLTNVFSSMSSGGLIPAHAGKTGSGLRGSRQRWAHPRSRGENPHETLSAYPFLGSSPLTRGKLTRMEVSTSRKGLIPAHAGKTTMTVWRPIDGPAHPRSRGENWELGGEALLIGGSSPLTRGKHGRWWSW